MATAMIAAAVKSTDEAKRRPPPRIGDKVMAMLPQVLHAVAGKAEHEQPRRPRHSRSSDHDENRRYPRFNGDDSRPSISDGKADVDGGDDGEAEGVDRRRVEPPHGKGRCSLPDPKDEPPCNRGSQRGG